MIQQTSRILRQLYLLRNITILFISLMVLLALFGLNINLPVKPLSIILLIMAVTNLLTHVFINSGQTITERALFVQLMIEILAFSLILYFAGGATNPLTFFYLIPLAIAATLIPGLYTWILTATTIGLYSLLIYYYIPLTYRMHDHDMISMKGEQFSQHVMGMWFGFVVSALLVSWFITYMALEIKRRDRAISEAKQREIRDQQMITLGTLAAGTAHELGTPLATLAIVSGDLTDGFNEKDHPELFENQKILHDQIKRCKDILSVLSDSAGESRAQEGYLLPAQEFIDRNLQLWQQQRPGIEFQLQNESLPTQGYVLFDITISQALINLINNAVDACQQHIVIRIFNDPANLCIDITDDGPGMTDEQIAMAGVSQFSDKPDGLGIGLYLATNTLRRCGGQVAFERLADTGTLTRIKLPMTYQQ